MLTSALKLKLKLNQKLKTVHRPMFYFWCFFRTRSGRMKPEVGHHGCKCNGIGVMKNACNTVPSHATVIKPTAAAATGCYATTDDVKLRCPPEDECAGLICLYGKEIDNDGCVVCDCFLPCQASTPLS